jgi:RecA/RadA recombinase
MEKLMLVTGLPGSGETTVLLSYVAVMQEQGAKVAWIVCDRAFDGDRAHEMLVKVNDLMAFEAPGPRGAYWKTEAAVKAGAEVVVIDSMSHWSRDEIESVLAAIRPFAQDITIICSLGTNRPAKEA